MYSESKSLGIVVSLGKVPKCVRGEGACEVRDGRETLLSLFTWCKQERREYPAGARSMCRAGLGMLLPGSAAVGATAEDAPQLLLLQEFAASFQTMQAANCSRPHAAA